MDEPRVPKQGPLSEAMLEGIGREMAKVWKDIQRKVLLPGESPVPNRYGEDDCVKLVDELELEFRSFVNDPSAGGQSCIIAIRVRLDLSATITVSGRSRPIQVSNLREWTPEQIRELFARGLDVAEILDC